MEGCACAEPPGMAPTVATSEAAAMMVMRLFRPLSTSGRSPLRVVRLPGELTGSGTTGPTPSPRRTAALRLDGDSPQMGWFPGPSFATPSGHELMTRRDSRMDLGLVHGYGRLRRHPNHRAAPPPNFQPACRDYFVTFDEG